MCNDAFFKDERIELFFKERFGFPDENFPVTDIDLFNYCGIVLKSRLRRKKDMSDWSIMSIVKVKHKTFIVIEYFKRKCFTQNSFMIIDIKIIAKQIRISSRDLSLKIWGEAVC